MPNVFSSLHKLRTCVHIVVLLKLCVDMCVTVVLSHLIEYVHPGPCRVASSNHSDGEI